MALIEVLLLVVSFFVLVASFFGAKSRVRRAGSFVGMYVVPVLLVLVAVVYPSWEAFLFMGRLAEGLLIFLLFVKPVCVIFSSGVLSRVVGFRKELGLVCFWMFLFHAVGLMFVNGIGFFDLFGVSYLVWGFVAGVVLFVLGITSNNFSINLLKRNWKNLHYLAYFALFATLFHTSFVSGNIVKFYVVFGVFVILKVLEWVGVRLFEGR